MSVTPVKRMLIGIPADEVDDTAAADQYGRRGATLPPPVAPPAPPPDIANLTAEAIRATAEKMVSDANATLEAAEGILKMLRTDTETFVAEVRRHSGNLAMRLTSYGDICSSASKTMKDHCDSIMKVAAAVASETETAAAAEGKTDG